MSSVVKRGRIAPLTDSIPIPAFTEALISDSVSESAASMREPSVDDEAWGQVAANILADAERRAQQIVAEAMEKASAILEEARLEGERRAQAAEREGREQGIREGRLEAQRELAQERARLQVQVDSLADELRRESTHRLVHQREAVLQLVVAIARRILQRELALESADVAKLVDEFLGHVVAASTVYVRVHPADCEALREAAPVLSLRHGGNLAVQVVPDLSLSPGDCVIASDGVEIDARVEARLDELSRVLAEITEEGPHGA